MSDFLFELGVEEVPVSEINSILSQLKSNFQLKLQENQVVYGDIETAATNKRFMIYFSGINAKADDKDEQIKGPAKRIAFDDQGNPTIPLQKFLEFNDVQMSDLSELETKKGPYMVVDKKTEGRPTVEILEDILPLILAELNFAKTMVWNISRVNFVRPVKNLLALFDNKVIPFAFAGIHSSAFVKGHHLLSDSLIEVKSFRDYCELLNKNFVMHREDDRREKILCEIKEIQDEYIADVKLTDEMLIDYLYNNEYPVVFQGRFDKKYLALPAEIISTFMIKEKKLLPMFDNKGNLMNMFVGVSNIPDENRYVKSGNERVIRATFEDAKFFWDNDREDDFISLREQLHNVMFQKELGTFFDKTERLALLVTYLVNQTGNHQLGEDLNLAALNCKNDLVTRMVREFPSLQGIMGGLYMKEKNLPQATWKAVYGHYEPKGLSTVALDDLGAGLLSMADKMDNIAGFLSRGVKISSSKDPYGIRRDANGIIKIILDFQLDFDLLPFIRAAAENYSNQEKTQQEITTQVKELFLARLENVFKDFLAHRYDVVNAVLSTKELYIYRMNLRATDMGHVVKTPNIEQLVMLHKRLKNIVKNQAPREVIETALAEEAEKILYDIFKETEGKIQSMYLDKQYLQGCSEFLAMKPVIDTFFDTIHIMAEDPKLKQNRIALVQRMDRLLSEMADFSLIVN